jgi:hypothetical protein
MMFYVFEGISFSGLALMVISMFVVQTTFRQMSFELKQPKSMREMIAEMWWVSSAKSKRIIQSYELSNPNSKVRRINRLAEIGVFAGLFCFLGSLVTCIAVVNR